MSFYYNQSAFISFKQEFSSSITYTGNNNDELNDDVKLTRNIIINTNRKLFKLITAITNFVKIFLFDKNCLIVQIQVIKNYKIKIFI